MKKKVVGIVTIISKNYGNRLQNYALQRVLKQLGTDVYTLPMKHKVIQDKIKEIIKLILYFFYKKKNWSWAYFNRYYIKWSKYTHCDSKINRMFDYFIAGSDQIWNPCFWFNSQREFLTFVPREKRIAYAASIGVSKLPDKETEIRFKGYWDSFVAISVREETAAQIIKNITGIDVPVLLDPTMLLSSGDWSDFSYKSKIKPTRKYIIKYFLDSISEDFEERIARYASKINAIIIDIHPDNIYENNYISPVEFVYLIQHSEFVFTNSFHAVVFSIIFHRRFAVFRRSEKVDTGDMNSRIVTILNVFNIRNRYVESIDAFDKVVKEDIIFTSVDEIMKKKRRESIVYLKKVLELEYLLRREGDLS